MRFVRALEIAGGDGVGEHEKRGAFAPRRREAFLQQLVFVVEHQVQALAGNIARRLAVDRVAERHVVRRDRLRDGPGSPAGLEENARHFLSRANFRERPVLLLVQVDRQCLPVRREEIFLFRHHSTLNGGGADRKPDPEPTAARTLIAAHPVSTGGNTESG
jgi:hypothetical protein